MKKLALIFLGLFTSTLIYASPKQETIRYSVSIDETQFSPTYQILGKNGDPIEKGMLALSTNGNLTTIKSSDFTVWEISPSGNSRTQLNSYSVQFKNLTAFYDSDIIRNESNNKNGDLSSFIDIKANGINVSLDTSIKLNHADSGYTRVEVFSNQPLPEPIDKNNNTIKVSVVAMLEPSLGTTAY